jgi:predicted metal-dependent RNase
MKLTVQEGFWEKPMFLQETHLYGKRHDIGASIHSISGYSAHADQKNLVNFIKRMRKRAKHVRLVHGEPDAQQALRTQLENLFKNQKSLDVSVLITHNVIDISTHHGGLYVSNYSTTP